MKSLAVLAFAVAAAALAGACSVRTETVEQRPVPQATVTTVPAPSTVVYTDAAPATTSVTVAR